MESVWVAAVLLVCGDEDDVAFRLKNNSTIVFHHSYNIINLLIYVYGRIFGALLDKWNILNNSKKFLKPRVVAAVEYEVCSEFLRTLATRKFFHQHKYQNHHFRHRRHNFFLSFDVNNMPTHNQRSNRKKCIKEPYFHVSTKTWVK